jgi:tRNA A-37 threonylcarbamoyl transferase component Bud32
MNDFHIRVDTSELVVVQLKIVDGYSSEWSGDVELRLEKTLRFLKGRREVWLAGTLSNPSAYIAKCFFNGEKQHREYTSELSGLIELAKRNLACPKLLFTAKDSQGGIWVITECIQGAVELSDIVLSGGESSPSANFASSFADTLLTHWRSGVHQTDAHLRNFLWDGQSIYTIDVGSIHFTKGALSVSKKCTILEEMLGGYLESFRRDLIHAFTQSCAQLDEAELLSRIDSPGFIRRVEQQEVKNLRRIWKKSRRDCSQFIKEQDGSRLLICQRELDPDLIEKLKHAPDDLMEMGQRLKSGNTCTVQQIEWTGRKMVLKRYNPKSVFYQIMHYFMHSRAMLSWMNGILLCRIGIPSVMPLAVVEEYRFGLLNRAYFLMDHFEGEDIRGYLNAQKHRSEIFDQSINILSSLFKRLRRFRIIHGDLKSKNILINESGLRLIDVDGLRFFVPARRFSRLFRTDFERFLDNWSDQPSLRKTLRSRFSDILTPKK